MARCHVETLKAQHVSRVGRVCGYLHVAVAVNVHDYVHVEVNPSTGGPPI